MNLLKDGRCIGESRAYSHFPYHTFPLAPLTFHGCSDSCEWDNLRSIFHPDAYIYTSWTGKTHHEDFIQASQRGMDKGAFIMHRCHGITTDITLDASRAVTKMKATITQRFNLQGVEVDAESDCRFIFFWTRLQNPLTGEPDWKALFVRHWYEKDKLIPVNPAKVPVLDEAKLAQFPSGYRYLAYCQEETMGVSVIKDLPGHNREKGIPGGSRIAGEKHDLLYWQARDWLDGKDIQI